MLNLENLKLVAEVAAEDGPWEPRLGLSDCETVFADMASPAAVLKLIEQNEALAGLYKMHKETEAREMRDLRAEVSKLRSENKRLRHVSAWVSVEERLPESGAPVLVWCDGCGCAGVAWIRQGAWLMPEPQPLGYESITHWMPLPAGPTATESRP